MHKIVIIEDDQDINEVLVLYLENAGFDVYTALTLADGEVLIRDKEPALLLLDVNLPDGNGFQFAREIRQFSDTIIIFITVHQDIEQKLEGFEAGGDDYITKPFIAKEVVARVQAQLRRKLPKQKSKMIIGDLSVDFDQKEVYKGTSHVNLFAKEKKLLFYLLQNANRVLSTEQIIAEVWGYDEIVDTKTIAVHMSTLRRKIGDSSGSTSIIQTVRGFGYKLVIS